MKKQKLQKIIPKEDFICRLDKKDNMQNSLGLKSKSNNFNIICFILLFFIFLNSSYAVCNLASTDFYCTCSGGYPCSSGDCLPAECSGSLCGAKEYYTFTGSCIQFGLAGYCQVADCNECDYQCGLAQSGCYGNCCGSDQCAADYEFCKTSTQIYTRDYRCTSYYCGYTDVLHEDCGYTGAYGDNYCVSSYTVRDRDVGACKTALGLPYCGLDVEHEYTFCNYGCASGVFESEYQYKCAGTLKDYSLQIRSIYGFCRIENSETFSNYGTGYICGTNSWCDSNYDEVVSTYSYELQSPCVSFSPTFTSTTGAYKTTQYSSYGFKVTSSQTHTPDLVCFDEYNDGVIDSCFGTGYTGTWTDIYYVNTNITGTKYMRIYAYDLTDGFTTTSVLQYQILSSYTDAEISLVSGANSNYESNISVNVELSSQFSITSGNFTSMCWSSVDSGQKCYGTLGNCTDNCPAYDHDSININTNYIVTSAVGKSESVTLFAYSTTGFDSDIVYLCFNDNSTGFYCGTCFDNIKNQNETEVDIGGSCGTCYDGFYNPASGETYIDYGGRCGTCYDNIKQNFESDVDYGGVCGNCTGNKSSDYEWKIGHDSDKSIPFDNTFCEGKSNAVISGLFLLILVLLIGALVIFLVISIYPIFVILGNIVFTISFLRNIFNKNKKK